MIFKTKQIYFALVILLIIIGGLSLFLVIQKSLPEPKTPLKVPGVEKEFSSEEFVKIVNNPETSKTDCLKIKNEHFKNLCLYSLTLRQAVQNEDVTLCEDLPQPEVQDCKNNYYFKMAKKNKNLELCSKITHDDLKENCHQDVKSLQQTAPSQQPSEVQFPDYQSICEKLETERYQSSCKELTGLTARLDPSDPTLTSSICEALDKKLARAICHSQVGVAPDELTDCNSFGEVSGVICSKIEEDKLRDQCVGFYKQLESVAE